MIARQIWCELVQHSCESVAIEMELNLIQRQVSKAVPIKRRIENQIYRIEDEGAVDSHPRLAPTARQSPAI